jgi:hypothetical protein
VENLFREGVAFSISNQAVFEGVQLSLVLVF